MSFAVIRDGDVVRTEGIGLANVEHRAPTKAISRFRSGSLVKPITATAVLQLAASGKLDLDKPAWHYCSAFPKKTHPVTSRALLSHTSGVRSYRMPWSRYEAELYNKTRFTSVPASLTLFADDPLIYEPGTDHVYTSYGYNLLGCVIEGASGMAYMAYLKQHIFNVAGMNDTSIDRHEDVVPDRAGGYRRAKNGALLHVDYMDLTGKIPGGGLLTTAVDMARFAAAFMNGRLLAPEQMALAMQPITLRDGSTQPYGLGWGLELPTKDNPQDIRLFHGGVTPGVSAIMYLIPARKSGVVIISNLYVVEGREALARRLLQHIGRPDETAMTTQTTTFTRPFSSWR